MKIRFGRALAAASLLCATLAAGAVAQTDAGKPVGVLKVAVYNDLAPFSGRGGGIDVDLAKALADRLGLRLSLMPFTPADDVDGDLRNMVWKGHYLGYGPADVMLHVPVDPRLAAANDKVRIFAPYYTEAVRVVRSAKTVPEYDKLDSLAGKRIGAEQISIGATLLLGEQNGKFRDSLKIYPNAIEALQALKAGKLDAVIANRSEIESVFHGDPDFPLHEVSFQRMMRPGWTIGMAVKKDQAELAERLQSATNELIASGEIAKIFGKYGVTVKRGE